VSWLSWRLQGVFEIGQEKLCCRSGSRVLHDLVTRQYSIRLLTELLPEKQLSPVAGSEFCFGEPSCPFQGFIDRPALDDDGPSSYSRGGT
jgi:hypothetical protein